MLRVLVVDHTEKHVTTLVETLRRYNYDAQGTTTGPLGLIICEDWKPHLVIVEGILKGMHAWEFGRRLLKDNQKFRPYMVALTGFPSKLHRALCEEHGFDEYVQKPIEFHTLIGWTAKARDLAGISVEIVPNEEEE